MKKLIGAILVAVMVVSLIPMSVSADEMMTAFSDDCVAVVGSTKCETVSDFMTAFAGCSGNTSVKLMADIDMGSSYLTVKTGQNITLNLYGHSLLSTGTQAIDVRGGNLTVNDTEGGKVTGGQRALICRNTTSYDSEIVINGGTFTGKNYAVFANSGCNLMITGGEFINSADGGTLPYAAVRYFCPGTCTITGGTFTGAATLKADYSATYEDDYGNEITVNADICIKGGTFNGPINFNRGIINIYDGNFDTNVNDYCADGYRTKTMPDGRYTIALYADADPIATIGTTTYQTVQEAVDAAQDGDVIKLLEGEKENVTIPEGKNITLDLNDSALLSSSGVTLTNEGTVNIVSNVDDTNAYIVSGSEDESNICVENRGKMIIGNNINLEGYVGVRNMGDLEYHAKCNAYMSGMYMVNGTAVIKEGSVYGASNGILVYDGDVTVEGGKISGYLGIKTFNGSVTLKDGEITGTSMGCYLLKCNTFTMTGGTINGGSEGEETHSVGLAVKGGNVDISGGSITSYGVYYVPQTVIPDKCSTTGDAIFVDASAGTLDGVTHDITINISDGTFTATNAYAISARYTAEEDHSTPVITISGGKFTSGADKEAIYVGNAENKDEFDGNLLVTGGTYSTDPASYVAPYCGTTKNDDETYTVVNVTVGNIEVVPYGGNYSLVKFAASSWSAFTYDGMETYSKDGVFYCIVENGTEADVTKIAAADSGKAYDDVVKGDINGNGTVNIIDAQIAYSIAKGVYSGFEMLTQEQLLKADFNNDFQITAADARAIQVYMQTAATE